MTAATAVPVRRTVQASGRLPLAGPLSALVLLLVPMPPARNVACEDQSRDSS
ncbi:hypothetical protein [Actinomadura sp. GTD37]|uniref:hypothetical protein n=1 Tax=Actinomadura sp. GTD37 TaxID=1778030 RepID=UPI0035BEE4D7